LGGSDIVGLMRQKIKLGYLMVSLGSFPPASIESRLNISLVEFLPENNVRTTVGCRYLGREPNFHHFSTEMIDSPIRQAIFSQDSS
jgi:hypothetical protein